MSKKAPESQKGLIVRPPVVVIMGHIDHGKSTLLDYIRKSNIVAGEAGGITQHLGAYEVLHNGKKITFLDTPGHEAFCGIRTRGATVADIAILVVSAEDGVKPQTIEALNCIKNAKLPYIVAMNKIDKPDANIERTKQNLAENEIYLEGYGGDIPGVPISALKGTGMPELLDMILLVSEMSELKGDPNKNAHGTVIEANLDNKKGISATLIIKDGTLKSGLFVVAGESLSPVRIMEDSIGKKIKEAGPSAPIKIIGFNKIPEAGSPFITCESKKEAEKLAEENRLLSKLSIKSEVDETEKVIIPLIIKADALGSLEGIKHELEKLKYDLVAIKIIHEGIGDIAESDIKIAGNKQNIVVVGFNVDADSKAKAVAERNGIDIKMFNIIYKITEYLAEIAKSRTPKVYTDESTGVAKIIRIFSKNKDKQVLGGKVQTGTLEVGSEVKVLRRDTEIDRGRIRELQSQKIKTSEVREGFEFGAMVECKMEIMPGDKIEAFKTVEK
ncbi:MAG: translation initiation factor IF-2 [Candidatus Taylorbacteria bacterium]|nr:translation initiation factor IF-2 [Candidatus Taylorbacteria bacterium]